MTDPSPDLADLLRRLAALEPSPDADAPLSRLATEFFAGNWDAAQTLLAAAPRLRVEPHPPAHRTFDFSLDVPYLRQHRPGDAVSLAPGPVRGTILYRADPFETGPDQPSVCVLVSRDSGLLHPNYSRTFGILCLGALPRGPLPLTNLLEHLYSILTYANVSTVDPADHEAADWFRQDPDALSALPTATPLWGVGAA